VVSGNTASSLGGGGYVHGTVAMSGGAVSGNTASSHGGGVYVDVGTFAMSGGEVSGNTASSSSFFSAGGGVSVSIGGTFSMSGGEVSGNTASSSGGGAYAYGGGVYISALRVTSDGYDGYDIYSGTFAMSGGTVSGNTVSSSSSYSLGGGVYVNDYGIGAFTMSGGAVNGNVLSGPNSYGREVAINSNGTFKMSGEARPERIFFRTYYYAGLTISGPLSGPVIPIDLGITSSSSLEFWRSRSILKLDSSYSSGDLASLKNYFRLGNSKMTNSPYTEAAITGYEINDEGMFVIEGSPATTVSSIAYSSVSGGTWTLQSDGRRKSPMISDEGTTKARISFTSTVSDAVITIQLDVSSKSVRDYAFISTLDNDSATYYSGYYTNISGSQISGNSSVTVSIPVPTAGSHFVDIGYREDGWDSGGSDCAWFEVIE
jgi:hypothetical protein